MAVKLFFAFLLSSTIAFAQKETDISKWNVTLSQTPSKPGDEVEIIFSALIDKNWKLYSSDFKNEIGPLPTEFDFIKNEAYQLVGEIVPVHPKKAVDPTWDVAYTYFLDKAEFRQKIKTTHAGFAIKGTIKGLLCSNRDGLCVPFQESFEIN